MIPTPDATAEMVAVREAAYTAASTASTHWGDLDFDFDAEYLEAAIIAGKRAYALAVLREQPCRCPYNWWPPKMCTRCKTIAELEQEQARGALVAVGGTS